MKKFLVLLFLSLCFAGLHAQNTISIGTVPQNLCAGQTVIVLFTTTGTFASGNVFTLEISDANGGFPGSVIGQLSCNTGCISIQGVVGENTSAGDHYRFRVNSSDPAIEGSDNASDIFVHSRPRARVNAFTWTPVTGSNLLFLGSGIGGSGSSYSFVWSGPNGFVSYQQNPALQSVTTQNSGSYSLIVTDDFGCSSNNNPVVDLVVYPQQLVAQNLSYNLVLPSGSNGSITVTANLPATYQWQQSEDQGTSWQDLSNNTFFQNVTSNSLQLTGVDESLDGNTFRCKLDFTGIGIAYSKPTILVIQGDTIITWIDSLNICSSAINGIHIPVKVKNFINVASISLSILYSMSDFESVSISNINPSLIQSGFVNSNTVHQYNVNDSRFSWFINSIYPLSLPDSAVLFDLVVNFIGNPSAFTFNPQNGMCQYSIVSGIIPPAIFYNGYLTTDECGGIQGTLTYDNTTGTPLVNQQILLKQQGEVKYKALTDSSGYYEFPGVATGHYDIEVFCDLAPTNTSSVDAMLGARYFAGMVPLTPLTVKAADVNQDAVVNAIDCLFMLRRSVGQINFYPAGDWKFSETSVDVSSGTNPQSLNIKASCTGDLNGSY